MTNYRHFHFMLVKICENCIFWTPHRLSWVRRKAHQEQAGFIDDYSLISFGCIILLVNRCPVVEPFPISIFIHFLLA